MNEKIKELAEQSGFELVDSGNIYILDYDGVCTGELNKFAELIVRECVHVCLNVDSEYFCEYINGKLCAEEIKQHFGVEP